MVFFSCPSSLIRPIRRVPSLPPMEWPLWQPQKGTAFVHGEVKRTMGILCGVAGGRINDACSRRSLLVLMVIPSYVLGAASSPLSYFSPLALGDCFFRLANLSVRKVPILVVHCSRPLLTGLFLSPSVGNT